MLKFNGSDLKIDPGSLKKGYEDGPSLNYYYGTEERDFKTFYGDDEQIAILKGGDDYLKAGGGNDIVYGGEGSDTVFGEDGDDRLEGGNGDDELRGGDNNDVLIGGSGGDDLYGGNHDDVLYGDYNPLLGGTEAPGNDTLWGGDGNDKLYGQRGDDHLYGGADEDVLVGGVGDDNLSGGAGEDILVGGKGDDTMWGEEFVSIDGTSPPPERAADTFVFDDPDWGNDTIKDFDNNIDKIDFSGNSLVNSLSDLTIGHAGNGDTLIYFDTGGPLSITSSIIVENITPAELMDDIIF